MNTSPRREVEELFSRFLTLEEEGESPDFEAFCAEHPAHADELRELKDEWDNVEDLAASVHRTYGATVDPEDVPGYTLRGKLGEGGMGEVYLADQQGQLEREVVVNAGEILHIPSHVPHKALALEEAVDTFADAEALFVRILSRFSPFLAPLTPPPPNERRQGCLL